MYNILKNELFFILMIIPQERPEFQQFNHLCLLTILLLISQASTIGSIYVLYFELFEKPFIVLFICIYSIICVYCIGFAIDNSPLLGISSLFDCIIVLYFIGIYNSMSIYIGIIMLFFSAYIKDEYCENLYNKKPIFLNMFLYTLLGFFPHIIPIHVEHQYKYFTNMNGFIML